MEGMSILWLVLFAVFLVVEASTVTVVSVWFATGSLVAMVTALLGGQIWLQVALFLVTSALLILLLRPVTKKYFNPRIKPTNTDAVINTIGIVTQEIDNIQGTGQVKLGAMQWSARSTDGAPISAGEQVRVDRIEGVKVYVTPVRAVVNQ